MDRGHMGGLTHHTTGASTMVPSITRMGGLAHHTTGGYTMVPSTTRMGNGWGTHSPHHRYLHHSTPIHIMDGGQMGNLTHNLKVRIV